MVTINNKEYKLKFTMRAMIIFEQITKKIFSIETLTDQYIYFYSLIVANNPDTDLTFDGLVDAIDEDPTLLTAFLNELQSYNNKMKQFATEQADSKKKS